MRRMLTTACFCLFMPASALAMGFGSGDDTSKPAASYDKGHQKAMAGDYSEAIKILREVVSAEPKNADAWNMLGFSYRNSGDADNAWDAYERALAINPSHRGAHEYIGEWYLMQGDMPSARAQLEKLKMLCPTGCEEYETLNAAIAKSVSNS